MKITTVIKRIRKREGEVSHELRWRERAGRRVGQRAGFTLLEVIVAFAIFFMVAFAILELTTRSLAAAKAIQQREPDAGMVVAMLATNKQWFEDIISGDFEDISPGQYSGWSWSASSLEISSNGLFEVTIVVNRDARKGPAQLEMKVLFYAPESPPGSASGGALGGF